MRGRSKEPAKKLTLDEAEERLLDIGQGCYEMKLRRPFEAPDGIFAEDVHIKMVICLERGHGKPNRDEITKQVAHEIHDRLKQHFSCSKHKAKLILRIYICDASEGDSNGRICSAETGFGAVRLCLGWTLSFPDGSVVLDGGRLGALDDHFYGLFDIFMLKSGERTLLQGLVPKLSKKIYQRIDLPSRKYWFQCF